MSDRRPIREREGKAEDEDDETASGSSQQSAQAKPARKDRFKISRPLVESLPMTTLGRVHPVAAVASSTPTNSSQQQHRSTLEDVDLGDDESPSNAKRTENASKSAGPQQQYIRPCRGGLPQQHQPIGSGVHQAVSSRLRHALNRFGGAHTISGVGELRSRRRLESFPEADDAVERAAERDNHTSHMHDHRDNPTRERGVDVGVDLDSHNTRCRDNVPHQEGTNNGNNGNNELSPSDGETTSPSDHHSLEHPPRIDFYKNLSAGRDEEGSGRFHRPTMLDLIEGGGGEAGTTLTGSSFRAQRRQSVELFEEKALGVMGSHLSTMGSWRRRSQRPAALVEPLGQPQQQQQQPKPKTSGASLASTTTQKVENKAAASSSIDPTPPPSAPPPSSAPPPPPPSPPPTSAIDRPPRAQIRIASKSSSTAPQAQKFGWVEGVLVRCIQSIFGVMLYLRVSWVAGQAGILLGSAVVLLGTLITVITALSTSAICTNGQISGGGAYYLISRSLGPEFGGSIGVIFSMANAVGAAMYVVGFAETMRDVMSNYGWTIIDGGLWDVRIIGLVACTCVIIVILVGLNFESKMQVILLVVLIASILDYYAGTVLPPSSYQSVRGVTGYSLATMKENLWPAFRDGYSFFTVFSVYFPAATGIMAGANISGDLRDPQRAIPLGTLIAIAFTSTVYLSLVWMTGSTVVRYADGVSPPQLLGESAGQPSIYPAMNVSAVTRSPLYYTAPACETATSNNCPYGLLNYFQVVELGAAWGPLITAGIFASTLSSALVSMVSAPKVFQAVCRDKLFPYVARFGRGHGPNQEPRDALFLGALIAYAIILIGELNAIAPIISNFFLCSYALINYACFDATFAHSPGFRPSFQFYNMWVSLAGSGMCIFVMFIISWPTALLTFFFFTLIFAYLAHRKPDVNWGSSTQAHSYRNALQYVTKLERTDEHVKNYRPQVLALSGNPAARPGLVDFAYSITKGKSLLMCGYVVPYAPSPSVVSMMQKLNVQLRTWFTRRHMKAFAVTVANTSMRTGAQALLQVAGIGKLRPNIMLMGFKTNWSRERSLAEINDYFGLIQDAFDHNISVAILRNGDKGLDLSELILEFGQLDDDEETEDSENEELAGQNEATRQNDMTSSFDDPRPDEENPTGVRMNTRRSSLSNVLQLPGMARQIFVSRLGAGLNNPRPLNNTDTVTSNATLMSNLTLSPQHTIHHQSTGGQPRQLVDAVALFGEAGGSDGSFRQQRTKRRHSLASSVGSYSIGYEEEQPPFLAARASRHAQTATEGAKPENQGDHQQSGPSSLRASHKQIPAANNNLPSSHAQLADMHRFQTHVRHGLIDVWWLYDDGGLTLLLPYLLTQSKSYLEGAKLRVFTLTGKRRQLDREQHNMAALLNKFRISYAQVNVLPMDASHRRPSHKTLAKFQQLIEPFMLRGTEGSAGAAEVTEGLITESELKAHEEKTWRHLRLAEMLRRYSAEADLIVMTLPVPRRGLVNSSLYMAWLDMLSRDLPPTLMIRGNQQSVLTFYS